MGKRELVLISVFVVLGIGVYRLTAPAPPPGSDGISFSSILRNLKRGIHGARESATADSQQTVQVDPTVRDLRVNASLGMSDITVTGEDRPDVAADMHTTAHGFDRAEAQALAAATRLKVERVGDALVVSLDAPSARSSPRRNRGMGEGGMGEIVIVLKVPRRLALRMEPHLGKVVVSHLASAEMMGSRGDTRVTGVSGRLALTHSGGALEIDEVSSLKLNARNSRGTIRNVGGPIAVDAVGGELRMSDLIGPLEIEARSTDVRIERINRLKAPLRLNATGGEIRVDGLRTDAHLDGRNSLIDVTLAAAAPVTIYNLGQIRVTAPPGGYALDAVASEGRIVLDDGEIAPSQGPDSHATGPIRGGGPTLTLRSRRGSITVRKPAGT